MSQIDEQQQKALNDEAEEINSRNATPVLEQDAPEEVEQTESTEEVETTETEGEKPKKGYQARIQELASGKKAAEAKALSLEAKLAELTNATRSQVDTPLPQFNPNKPLVEEGEEISAAELNRRVAERDAANFRNIDALVQLRTNQNQTLNRIDREAAEAVQLYPELDPESDSFNQELSETIAEAVEAKIKADPYNTSVKKYVAKLMKPFKGAIDKEVGEANENIAKQVSQAALRPTSIRKEEKTAAEMTPAELEAKLGVLIS